MRVTKQPIIVAGCGILGLWQALILARAGHAVRLLEESPEPFAASSSRWAGAMLAPECEAESAPPEIASWGRAGLAAWHAIYPQLIFRGTLVVAAARDQGDLIRFERMTEGHRRLDATAVGQLEPAFAHRFSAGLHFAEEAHMNALHALNWLLDAARAAGAEIQFGKRAELSEGTFFIDCRGWAARDALPTLRGVRGERIIVAAPDVDLTRPVRLLHPRQPIYVVPQGDRRYVIGATVIERDDAQPVTVRSALELLGSAYALHPGFAEAAIIDMGAGVRPAFADNMPRIVMSDGGRVLHVNGAYRHGFLLAPVLADAVRDYLATGSRHTTFAAA